MTSYPTPCATCGASVSEPCRPGCRVARIQRSLDAYKSEEYCPTCGRKILQESLPMTERFCEYCLIVESFISDWDIHEFCEGDQDEKRCRFCGGYPFDLLHWTI
jgi:DNA-directed RNA polymerase subunit RPC12/RpoP